MKGSVIRGNDGSPSAQMNLGSMSLVGLLAPRPHTPTPRPSPPSLLTPPPLSGPVHSFPPLRAPSAFRPPPQRTSPALPIPHPPGFQNFPPLPILTPTAGIQPTQFGKQMSEAPYVKLMAMLQNMVTHTPAPQRPTPPGGSGVQPQPPTQQPSQHKEEKEPATAVNQGVIDACLSVLRDRGQPMTVQDLCAAPRVRQSIRTSDQKFVGAKGVSKGGGPFLSFLCSQIAAVAKEEQPLIYAFDDCGSLNPVRGESCVWLAEWGFPQAPLAVSKACGALEAVIRNRVKSWWRMPTDCSADTQHLITSQVGRSHVFHAVVLSLVHTLLLCRGRLVSLCNRNGASAPCKTSETSVSTQSLADGLRSFEMGSLDDVLAAAKGALNVCHCATARAAYWALCEVLRDGEARYGLEFRATVTARYSELFSRPPSIRGRQIEMPSLRHMSAMGLVPPVIANQDAPIPPRSSSPIPTTTTQQKQTQSGGGGTLTVGCRERTKEKKPNPPVVAETPPPAADVSSPQVQRSEIKPVAESSEDSDEEEVVIVDMHPSPRSSPTIAELSGATTAIELQPNSGQQVLDGCDAAAVCFLSGYGDESFCELEDIDWGDLELTDDFVVEHTMTTVLPQEPIGLVDIVVELEIEGYECPLTTDTCCQTDWVDLDTLPPLSPPPPPPSPPPPPPRPHKRRRAPTITGFDAVVMQHQQELEQLEREREMAEARSERRNRRAHLKEARVNSESESDTSDTSGEDSGQKRRRQRAKRVSTPARNKTNKSSGVSKEDVLAVGALAQMLGQEAAPLPLPAPPPQVEPPLMAQMLFTVQLADGQPQTIELAGGEDTASIERTIRMALGMPHGQEFILRRVGSGNVAVPSCSLRGLFVAHPI